MSARPGPDHGRRHRRARLPGAGAGAPAARAVARGRLARHAARARGARRSGRAASRSNGCRSAACAARAALTLLAAPFRLRAGAVAGAARDAAASARWSWWASAASSPGPAALPRGSRAGRSSSTSRMPIAGFTNRCLAHLAREVLEAFPGQLRPRRARRAPIGNPVRAGHQRAAAARGALRRPQRRDPHARHRRQPGRGAAECGRALRAGAPRPASLAFDVRHQAGERWIEAGAQSYAQARRARRRAALHRGHGRGLRAGRTS